MDPTTSYDLTAIAKPIWAEWEPVALAHFAGDCVCGERMPRGGGSDFVNKCDEFSRQFDEATENAIPADLEWLLEYARRYPQIWTTAIDGRVDTPLAAIKRAVTEKLEELVDRWWEELARAQPEALAAEKPRASVVEHIATGYAVLMHSCKHGLSLSVHLVHNAVVVANQNSHGIEHEGVPQALYAGQVGDYAEETLNRQYCSDTYYAHVVHQTIESLQSWLNEQYTDWMKKSIDYSGSETEYRTWAEALVGSVMTDIELALALLESAES